MSALNDKGITLEGFAAAADALRQELATWKALAHKQDQLTADQITATQSGATAAKISQIAVNTAAIQSLAAQVAGQISLAYVTTLPATGEPLTLYLVPQGDGTAPNFCNEYLWINDAWELIGTTGAMANNGELTIQVNGVAVGTFTANQAANAAVNITVPTNTNQLVNGAQFVDAAALQAALALKQNSLNATQLEAVNSGITAAAVQQIADNATAIAGKQDALTAAQQAAVDSGATAAKIDQIASNASAIVSLTSSKQDTLSTTQLAAVNSGVTSAAVTQIGTNADNISSLQTAVSGKAADSEVVHLAGAETITGNKTFTGSVVTHNLTPETTETYSLGSSSLKWRSVYAQTYYYNGTAWGLDKVNEWTDTNTFSKTNSDTIQLKNVRVAIGETISSDAYTQVVFKDKNTDNLAYIKDNYIANGANNLVFYVRNKYNSSGSPSTTGHVAYTFFGLSLDNTGKSSARLKGDFYPYANNSYSLGTSTSKWETLNGINPGALSLPDTLGTSGTENVNYFNVIGYLNNTGVLATIPSTATYDGWLYINAKDGADSYIIVDDSPASFGTSVFGNNGLGSQPIGLLCLICPIRKGHAYNVRIKSTGVVSARIYPAQGNV